MTKKEKRTSITVKSSGDLFDLQIMLSTILIIIRIDEIHRFHPLMDIDKRSYEDDCTENTPEPEITCSE